MAEGSGDGLVQDPKLVCFSSPFQDDHKVPLIEDESGNQVSWQSLDSVCLSLLVTKCFADVSSKACTCVCWGGRQKREGERAKPVRAGRS